MVQNDRELISELPVQASIIDEAEIKQFADELGVDVSEVPEGLLSTIRVHLGLDLAPDPDLIVDHLDLLEHRAADQHETHRAAQIAKHILSKQDFGSDTKA